MSSRATGGAPHHPATTRVARATVDIEAAGDTPILREYRSVKSEHSDCIVLARLGDFYEMFGTDAERAAPLLGLTLTGRNFGNAGRVPMCGIPHHAATQHIRRLIETGHRVAIWEQVGDVSAGRLMERRVTRVLSAGTATDDDLLSPMQVARCVALAVTPHRVGAAALDVSTGDLELFEVGGGADAPPVHDELLRLDARELLIADGTGLPDHLLPDVPRTPLAASVFDLARADSRLLTAAGASSVTILGAGELPLARSAAGAALAYAERCGIKFTPELLRVRVSHQGSSMRLDAQTRRNLELLQPLSGTGASLFSVLDHTRTAMGSRLLRSWLQEPLLEVGAIGRRAQSVEELVGDAALARDVGQALRGVRDLQRLVARCVNSTASARDLAALRDTMQALRPVREATGGAASEALAAASRVCTAPPALLEHLERLLVDEPAGDDGSVRRGADSELDSLVDAAADARSYIASLEQQERERTGIRSLKVGYNRVFGYYIEIPNTHRESVPQDYIRKQTLSGGERFITADLREQESIVLHARARTQAREHELLRTAAQMVAAEAQQLSGAAQAVAEIDCLASLAAVASREGWVRPVLDASEVIDIEQGRHPVVERALGAGHFVPNDTALDAAARILLLTGPNMAGKSTYLRQVAVIMLLAQVGSFVPARRARLGICDRIFTRIGAHDDLGGGLSTFMVEMAETAAILRQATPRSLVILDEIGRGTSTYDGLSIAQAVTEHLHDSPSLNCRTLFATHYHELTRLEESLTRLRNARVEVLEENGEITFLHRIVAGGADRSYGLHVAKLAGVPATVLLRARTLLDTLERTRPLSGDGQPLAQLSLELDDSTAHPLVAELAGLEIEAMSPISALNKLAELRERAAL